MCIEVIVCYIIVVFFETQCRTMRGYKEGRRSNYTCKTSSRQACRGSKSMTNLLSQRHKAAGDNEINNYTTT